MVSSCSIRVAGMAWRCCLDGQSCRCRITACRRERSPGRRWPFNRVIDFLLRPELVQEAWTYFNDVQTRDLTYTPFIRDDDQPAIEINRGIMAEFRDEMREYYFDPERFGTYLEQLGVDYPTLRAPDGTCGVGIVP